MLSPEQRAKVLLEVPPKRWVAFSEDEFEVIGHAATYEEAVSLAESKGVDDPVLPMTRESWAPMIL